MVTPAIYAGLALALCLATQAANYGEKCDSDDDCATIDRAYCGVLSFSCPDRSRRCVCIPGHTCNKNPKHSGVLAGLGDLCDSDDVCLTDYAICYGGVCQCKAMFARYGDGCIPRTDVRLPVDGDYCRFSLDCPFPQDCYRNKCSCPRGRHLGANFYCEPNALNDPCGDDIDCRFLYNSFCSQESGKCACVEGYRAVQYRTSPTSLSWGCIEMNETLASIGEACHQSPPKDGKARLCAQQRMCIDCWNDHYVCEANSTGATLVFNSCIRSSTNVALTATSLLLMLTHV